MRVYPHLQDTGGFFVTVIEKVQEYGPIDAFIAGKQDGDAEEEEMEEVEEANAEEGAPAAEEAEEISAELAESKVEDASDAVEDKSESEEAKPTDEEVASEIPEESTQTTPPTKEQKNKNLKMAWKGREKPFFFVENDDEIKQFSAMYGLSETFPRDQFVVRSDALKHQTVYFVSSGVKSVLLANNSYRLTVVNTGVKIFSRHDNHTKECPFRLNTEGLSTIGPFLSEVRVLQVPMSDLLVILRMNNPLFSSLSEATEKWLINLGAPGSCMFKYVPTEEDKEKELIQTALLPIWRAGVSASLLLNKVSRQGWLQRILGVEYNAEAEEKLLQDSMVNVGKKDVEEV
ncbi:tRNA (cytosine(34)-C(5))-methyltransferase [Nowakowskiella sp. JEL0407]|nr:tRNA (cytosine(34)-C(5))-methyltransferase [Nowakowskiella sp. JEL0407]